MAQGTDFILNAIYQEGVNHVFMVPGGLIDPFLPALQRNPFIRPVVAAQEGGAAYMADGYARAGGKFGVALCIGGPGLTNTVTAVATAQTDGSPLMILSGEVATGIEGLGMFQDASAQTLDDVSILKPVTRFSTSVDNHLTMPHLFRHALLKLLTPPQGPVHLSLPKDSQVAEISAEYKPVEKALTSPGLLSLGSAHASLSHFQSMDSGKLPVRIVILAGSGVEHAGAASRLLSFSQSWHIPVATTLRAKGIFPEDHPLSLGVFGYAGTHHARAALLDATPDLLILLGSGLEERDTMHWSLQLKPSAVICVNLDTTAIGTHASNGAVVGDCGAYLDFLDESREQISASLQETIEERGAWLNDIKSRPRFENPSDCESEAVPVHPARIIAEFRSVFPRDGILVVDSGAHRAFAGHYWQSFMPGTYVSATNLGPMGWAIPAAAGVQCARPDRRVAVITGDGCMHMHGIEIATASRYRLPVLFLVVNNSALGNVWLRAHSSGALADELTSLPDVDWAAFGRSLGCQGETVKKPEELKAVFESALDNKGPVVIDIKSDKKYKTPVSDWVSAVTSWSYHE